MMLAVRGVFDGKVVKPLPSEPLPEVDREVPVAIIFLESLAPENLPGKSQKEIAEQMLAARDAMPPLGFSVTELIEEGRER